jgi:UDP-GlcNAc3NAcA epimerase
MLKIATVIGARPQFVKAAVLSRVLRSEPFRGTIDERLIHTGQHYDDNMSEVFFREMGIPEPNINLGVGGGSHGKMTGLMLGKIEAELLDARPDLLVVYGDTNSTLAGALAASKLGIPIAHVEAGLRSYDKTMPEEQNRVLADHLSAMLFCPTETAVGNLLRESIGNSAPAPRPSSDAPAVLRVGDVMLDASLYYRSIAAGRPTGERCAARLFLPASFRLLTLHRAENTDNGARLAAIVGALNRSVDMPIVFPIHPRTRKRIAEEGIALAPHIMAIEPVGFLDMIELESACSCVLTDSGGVQKEAFFFGKPCITLRETTEWVETIESGWNKLVGADGDRIIAALRSASPGRSGTAPYGDGRAGEAIALAIIEGFSKGRHG